MLVAVPVMHDLATAQGAAQDLLCNNSVLVPAVSLAVGRRLDRFWLKTRKLRGPVGGASL